ncbi:MAG: GHKL domain-containing protein [Clostridium sp.]|nr:GHKL domain-containing protein [Clostridium sp.]
MNTITDVLDLGYPLVIIFFISTKFLYWLLLYIVTKITDFSNKRIVIDNSTILLTLFPIFSFIMFVILHVITVSNSLTRMSEYLFVAVDIFLILCNVFIIWLYDYNLAQHEALTKLRLEHQHINDTENYNKLMTQHNENQKILIHDIKNHLQAVYSLNMDQKYTQANSYLSNLLDTPVLTHTYEPTNSHDLNLLLSRYITICDEKRITFTINARNTDLSYMKLEDITTLFCNLIDNAIEAAEGTEHAHVNLQIQDSENSTQTVITVINSSSRAPIIKNNHYRTSKSNPYMHGIGTYSLQRVIEKYKGDFETYYLEAEKEFHAVILLRYKEV